MEKRKLGKSKLLVTPIGLGCRTLGAKAKTEEEAIELVQKAVELGINFIDTANIYRRGLSEKIVGKAIMPIRRKVILATKGSIVISSKGIPTQDLKPESVRLAVRESLERLQTDYIDLYQIHYPDPATPFKETIKALKEFIETGTIRYVGLSNFTPEELEEWSDIITVPSIQLPYNFIQQKAYNKLLPITRESNISMIIYTPLLMGLFTGKITRDATFAKNDERSNIPRQIIDACIEINNQLQTVAEKYDKTIAQLVLNFIMNRPGIGCVLVGASSIDQLKENVGAALWTLPEKERHFVETLIKDIKISLDEHVIVQGIRETFSNYAGKHIAVLDMGLKFFVPSTVKAGDRIKISWSGEYLGIAD